MASRHVSPKRIPFSSQSFPQLCLWLLSIQSLVVVFLFKANQCSQDDLQLEIAACTSLVCSCYIPTGNNEDSNNNSSSNNNSELPSKQHPSSSHEAKGLESKETSSGGSGVGKVGGGPSSIAIEGPPLKSNLKKTTIVEEECQLKNGKRKVTWPDAHGKDLAHVQEFHSRDEIVLIASLTMHYEDCEDQNPLQLIKQFANSPCEIGYFEEPDFGILLANPLYKKLENHIPGRLELKRISLHKFPNDFRLKAP
ncbi:hypothetical protein ACLOJK_011076 [Asimina triloba]